VDGRVELVTGLSGAGHVRRVLGVFGRLGGGQTGGGAAQQDGRVCQLARADLLAGEAGKDIGVPVGVDVTDAERLAELVAILRAAQDTARWSGRSSARRWMRPPGAGALPSKDGCTEMPSCLPNRGNSKVAKEIYSARHCPGLPVASILTAWQ
jgi:hypothetical protein